MIDDFGPDFDEDGQPLEEGESDRVKDEEEHAKPGRTEEEAEDEREAEKDAEEAEKTVEDGRGGGPGMATRKEVKNRISSVKNIHKITRAMEMVAAARLRRAEERIAQPAPLRAGAAQDDPPGLRGGRDDARHPRARGARGAEARSGSCWSPATAASRARSTPRSSAPGSS